MKKRIMSILTAAALAASCFSLNVYASENMNYGLTDISEHWAERDIVYAVEEGFMHGFGNEFRPDSVMTRSMFVSSLSKIAETAGLKEPDNKLEEKSRDVIYGAGEVNEVFSDMDGSEPYADDVKWAVENGIIKGIDGAFCPDGSVSRQMSAVILFRFTEAAGISLEEDWSGSLEYNDLEDISDWAVDGIAYCNVTGLMSGDPEGFFNPLENFTRAEAAAVMTRIAKGLAV